MNHVYVFLFGLAITSSTAMARSAEFTPDFVDSLVPSYLALQKALTTDNLAAAQKASKDLYTATLNGPEIKDFTGSVHEIITATDLKSVRANFAEVSTQLITLINHVGTTGGVPLFSAHCAMAFGGRGGDWIQADQGINNPYYGSKMLRCGEILDHIGGIKENDPYNPGRQLQASQGADSHLPAKKPDTKPKVLASSADLAAVHANVPGYFTLTAAISGTPSGQAAGTSSCGMACCNEPN
mgnify:CR=1 FL=1